MGFEIPLLILLLLFAGALALRRRQWVRAAVLLVLGLGGGTSFAYWLCNIAANGGYLWTVSRVKQLLRRGLKLRAEGVSESEILLKLDGTDHWGRPLRVEWREGRLRITSLGADGRPGGEWRRADISGEAEPDGAIRLKYDRRVRL